MSCTLNRINGMSQSDADGWDKWVSDRDGRDVALSDASLIRSPEEDLLELSDADLSLLRKTWEDFWHLSKFQIRDYTHDKCPEWNDPHGSSIPIDMTRFIEVLDYNPEQIKALLARIKKQNNVNAIFAEG